MAAEQIESRWLVRGHKFFRALARNGVIRGALLQRGLTNEELQRGWDLFSTALGFARGAPPVGALVPEAVNALQRLEAWDAPNYATAQAMLEHRTPAACAYLMQGLTGATGPDAVVGIGTFIDRVNALREGTVDGVSATESALAVKLLAERKVLDESIEAELRGWIVLTQQGATPRFGSSPAREAAAAAAFTAYRNWLNEWRVTARATITQRSYLISLGLAARRHGEEEEAATPPAVEAAPVSVH